MSNFDERLLQLIAEERFCGKSPLFDDTSDLRLFQLTDCEDTARMPFKDIAIKVYCMALDDFVMYFKSMTSMENELADKISEHLKESARL